MSPIAPARGLHTVFDAFAETARSHPQNDFLCVPARADRDWRPEGVRMSYGEALAQALALRDLYSDAGYGHGHRIALLLENRPEFMLHYLAANSLGCSIVPINPDSVHDEVLYQMEHSAADLAVVLSHRVADLERVARAMVRPLPVMSAQHMSPGLPRPGPSPRAGEPGPDTECGLLYTSGTTGRPKGCILSNGYYLDAGAGYRDQGGVLALRRGEDRLYNPLPMYHMNHQAVTATCALLTANCMILPERFSPARWWQEIAQTRATVIHYLGIVPPMLLNQPECREEKEHRVRFGIGAGVEPQLHPAFEQRFGFPLVEVWGMTETGRIFADNVEPRQITTRAFGRPYPGLEAKVVDAEQREVARGAEGELLVRHTAADPRRGFFSGYFRNEAATEEAWRGDWFHTGDVVRQARDGMLYFVDRKKHIIRRSGENIAAAEIEAVLQAHEAVLQVAVVPAPDELREEEVFACIVAKPGRSTDGALARALADWCREKLAYYKAPGWVLFVDALPTTGTQKVQKTKIFAAGEDPRVRAGAIDLRELKRRK